MRAYTAIFCYSDTIERSEEMPEKADKWLNFSEASRQLKKGQNFISTNYVRHPEYFEGIEIMESGRNKMLKESDLPQILAQLKKGGARKNSEIFFRVERQSKVLTQAPAFNFTGKRKIWKGGYDD